MQRAFGFGQKALNKTFTGASRRPISTVAKANKKGADGRELAGHIQFQLNEYEQSKYDLPEVVGLTGGKGQSFQHPVEGSLRNGEPFSVKGLLKTANPIDQDRKLDPNAPDVLSVDHGTMTPEQGYAFRNFINQQKNNVNRTIEKPFANKDEMLQHAKSQNNFDVYETSGQLRTNCVHAHNHLAGLLFGVQPKIHDHTKPEEQFQNVKNLRIQKGNGSNGQ